MPDVTPEAPNASQPAVIRAEIAKMVGLDPDKAAEIAKQRDQEAEVVRICKNNASETYNRLKEGEEVDVINLGIGKFDLSPTDNIRDLLTNFKKRIDEINPKPPQEQIDIWSNQIGESALGDKQFAIAVNWYSYITNDHLGDIENASYIGKMASFAITPDEKYDLGLALQQVWPQAETAEATPQETPVQPAASNTSAVSAESIAADEAAWRAAAGISPATSESKAPTAAPLQPDASIFSSAPPSEAQPQSEAAASTGTPAIETLPPTVPAEVPAPPAPMPVNITPPEQTFPQPQPIKVPTIAPKPLETTPPVANNNLPDLRPVPTRAEAAAQGLIEDVASRIPTTPSISSSEAELAA